jgi:uncharacterized protein YecA (UPF0149 family)
VFGFEGVDVFQEDQAEDDVLVLRSVHVVAERICHAPQLRFIDTDKGVVGHSDFQLFPVFQSANEAIFSSRLELERERKRIDGWKRRFGRNDRCPCGSGKKFKKSCGLLP